MKGGAAPSTSVLLALLALTCARSADGARDRLHDPVGAEEPLTRRKILDTGEGVAKISSGRDAPCGRYPYMASLRDSASAHKCGAVLVDRQWLVTAAHCVRGGLGMSVAVGGCVHNETFDDAEVSVPKEIITHTNFTGEVQGGYDIAMIRLKEPTEKTPISLPPISQNGPRLGVGNILVALGWGLVPDALPPERLQEAGELLFVPNDVCNGFWDDRIDGTMMCAAGTGEFRGQGTCKGDSGGPLLIANAPGSNTSNGRPQLDILVGITSFGEKDCETGSKPGVYAQVAAFHLWIEEIIETDGAAAKVTPTPAATLIEATPSASTSPQVKDPVLPSLSPTAVADASTTPSTQGDPQESLRLWTAAATGSVRNAKDALDKGADVNFTSGALGDAPLHLAATSGNLEMVQVLIAAGADVNQGRSSDRFTPLVSASKAGHHKVVRALVEANADVELASKAGHTPLMWASFGSHPQVVETLLDARADPNSAVNLQKRPALHFVYQVAAASSDRITNMLLDAGADIDWQDTEKYTPLMAATYFGNPGVANVLVVRGADVSLGDLGGNTAADIICACLSQNACPNGRCKSGGEEAQIEALFK